jgi:5-methylcytosine-specific restriction protein A
MPEKDGEPGNQVSQFIVEVSDQEVRREKDKARELRRTRWWKNKVAQGVCHYCGRNFPPEELTMDHIVPITRGGKSIRGNVAPACKECNSRKKYLLPIEWEDYLQSMGKGE